MNRRQSLAMLTGLCFYPAIAAMAQETAAVVFLGLASEAADRTFLEAFRQGLVQAGRPAGGSITFNHLHTDGDLALAARLVADLEGATDVFVVPGPAAARVVRSHTAKPVVSIGLPSSDPFLFASLAHPAGSVTGLSSYGEDLAAKRVEVIREALPGLTLLGLLHNTSDLVFREWGVRSAAAAEAAGLATRELGIVTTQPAEVGELLADFRAGGGSAVLVIRDFLTHTNRDYIAERAASLGLALIAEHPAFVAAGALMAYGEDAEDAMRRAAYIVVRILNGERPGDIPIELPTRFRLDLNLATADRLGMRLPPSLLARADRIIE